jgi:hypothetical protein
MYSLYCTLPDVHLCFGLHAVGIMIKRQAWFAFWVSCIILKVKQSLYMPGQALRVPGGWGLQISWHSECESGTVVSPTHRPPSPTRKYSWYSFLLDAESTPGKEKLGQWKIPMASSGIEPTTFRLVEQCLSQMRHCLPPVILYYRY